MRVTIEAINEAINQISGDYDLDVDSEIFIVNQHGKDFEVTGMDVFFDEEEGNPKGFQITFKL